MRLGTASQTPLERGAEIVVVEIETVYPLTRGRRPQLGFGPLGQVQKVVGVPPAHSLALALESQLLESKFTNRLEHAEAHSARRAYGLQQTAGNQSVDAVQHIVTIRAHRLRRLQAAAADKDGHAAKKRLPRPIEQVIAPGNSVAQGVLARRQVARTTGEKLQPMLQPSKHCRRIQKPHASRCELDGQWQSVHAAANLDNGARVLRSE